MEKILFLDENLYLVYNQSITYRLEIYHGYKHIETIQFQTE